MTDAARTSSGPRSQCQTLEKQEEKAMDTYHAIEIIGYGKHTRYSIKRVETGGRLGHPTVRPVMRRTFRSELDARDAAELLGIEIMKVGDAYQIV